MFKFRNPASPTRRPVGLEWRSSVWFSTLVVGLGLSTDLLVYSIPIPVLPFQLQRLNYDNVSSRVGWLLFAFSAALVLSTPPLAMMSERYGARRWPLIIGLLALVASQIMFMEAPSYAVLCVARFIQGVSSSVVWIIGLALLCDCVPERNIGRQMGLAMTGLTLGMLIGPPVSGALYGQFGLRGPYIFGIGITIVDLTGRLLIIERKDALKWGIDTLAITDQEDTESQPKEAAKADGGQPPEGPEKVEPHTAGLSENAAINSVGSEQANEIVDTPTLEVSAADPAVEQQDKIEDPVPPTSQAATTAPARLSLMGVVLTLGRAPRALAGMVNTLIFAIAFTAQEPSMPLHLQNVWGLNATMVGVVMIGGVVTSAISSPLAGWYSDIHGPEWVVFFGLLFAIPWWVVITIPGHLALFITAYALESFFTAAFMAPLMAELAAVSRDNDGIGYAHVYGAFNIAYGIGSAVGPLIGGQLYDHVRHGWTAVCITAVGLLSVAIVLAATFCGADPLLARLCRKLKGGSEVTEEASA